MSKNAPQGSKSNNKRLSAISFRYPLSSDAQILTDYLNELVGEDVMIEANYKKVTLEEEEEYLNKFLVDIQNKKAVYLCVFDSKTQEFLGSANVSKCGFRKQHIGCFGISLKKSARGKGIGLELMREITKLAQVELGVTKLILTCYADNKIAQGLYVKMGFVKYGQLPGAILYKGKLVDEIQMFKDL